MATTFKEGDRVQIADREATADDSKSGLFYNHFRGLIGTVQKVYATQEVAVDIEPDSLPESVEHRHSDVQEQMKTKWLDGLSEEAKNRLSDKEKDFRLRYTVLVSAADLIAPGKKPVRAVPQSKPTPALQAGDGEPKRKTLTEIEEAENAYFNSRRSTNGTE